MRDSGDGANGVGDVSNYLTFQRIKHIAIGQCQIMDEEFPKPSSLVCGDFSNRIEIFLSNLNETVWRGRWLKDETALLFKRIMKIPSCIGFRRQHHRHLRPARRGTGTRMGNQEKNSKSSN